MKSLLVIAVVLVAIEVSHGSLTPYALKLLKIKHLCTTCVDEAAALKFSQDVSIHSLVFGIHFQ